MHRICKKQTIFSNVAKRSKKALTQDWTLRNKCTAHMAAANYMSVSRQLTLNSFELNVDLKFHEPKNTLHPNAF